MLHTINKSPFGNSSFETSARFLQPGDPVLFIEDGVYAVQANNKFSAALNEILKNNPVYALAPDLNARGIAEITAGVKSIEYEGFVELVEEHQVSSWL
ncbi:MAG: sulfurtransferase complex subunit TusB [Deltaproteobacteria bacterium]|nr:sulfurtransferase complex subunit TusB [Deltaproteobacteria bacterium]